MNIKAMIPTAPQVIREGLIVLGGVLLAAYFLSKFPKLKQFVTDQSITVKDSNGGNLY